MSTKIQLIFSNSKLPLSPFIRFVTWSDWSHVGLLIDGNLRSVDPTIRQVSWAWVYTEIGKRKILGSVPS